VGVLRVELMTQATDDLVHRFRNFGEDVYRALGKGLVDLDEIDEATTCFHVRGVPKRQLSQVRRQIEAVGARNGFEGSLRVSPVDEAA